MKAELLNIKLLLLADIHGNDKALNSIYKNLGSNINSFDGVIIAGDLPVTTPKSLIFQYVLAKQNLDREGYSKWVYKGRGREYFVKKQIQSIKKIVSVLNKFDVPIYYVSGNVDTLEARKYLSQCETVKVLDFFLKESNSKLKGIVSVLGISGSLVHISDGICDGEYSPQEFKKNVELFMHKTNFQKPWLLLTHEPPFFTRDKKQQIKNNTKSLYKYEFKDKGGSRGLLRLIKRKKPTLVVSGHYHEYRGMRKIEGIPVVNPGCTAVYQYAIVDMDLEEQKGIWKPKNVEIKFLEAPKRHFDFISSIYSQRKF